MSSVWKSDRLTTCRWSGMEMVAHSGATSGHDATWDVSKRPYAAARDTRQEPAGRMVRSAPPPERLGLAQAGQAYAAGAIAKKRIRKAKKEDREIRTAPQLFDFAFSAFSTSFKTRSHIPPVSAPTKFPRAS